MCNITWSYLLARCKTSSYSKLKHIYRWRRAGQYKNKQVKFLKTIFLIWFVHKLNLYGINSYTRNCPCFDNWVSIIHPCFLFWVGRVPNYSPVAGWQCLGRDTQCCFFLSSCLFSSSSSPPSPEEVPSHRTPHLLPTPSPPVAGTTWWRQSTQDLTATPWLRWSGWTPWEW